MALTPALGALAVLVAGLGDLAPVAVVLCALVAVVAAGRSFLTVGRAAALSEIHRLALTDDLTGLANRRAFFQALDRTVADSAATADGFAVLVLDLDEFKEVNDTLGHHAGDAVLGRLGGRLAAAGAGRALVARLGGDEFAALVRRPTEGRRDDRPLGVANELLRAVREPLDFDGLELALDASIGIALYPDHATDGRELLRLADVAMYQAKRDQSRLSVYRRESNPHTRQRLALVGQLKQAIERRELTVHYQPQIDAATGAVCGLESLVRWCRDGDMVAPGEFLPVAERNGLMQAVTAAVLDEVVLQLQRWQARGQSLPVAVNLSPSDLRNHDLVDEIRARLARHGLAPELLHVEVTEHVLMRDPYHANAILQGLRAAGVRVALDDFGTGHSSLAYVQRLGLDTLKIDRQFVTDMCRARGDAVIVGVAIDLARAFGLEVVAEGVETADVATALANRGCDVVQGYWVCPPLSADEVELWLDRHEPEQWAA